MLVSTELDEVLGLADRIAVMYRGRSSARSPAGTSAEQIGLLMAGASSTEARRQPHDAAQRPASTEAGGVA